MDAPLINHVCFPKIKPGIYRIQELAEQLGVSRTTINRYIEKFSLPLEDMFHQNKPVKGVVLDAESVEKITTFAKQGSDPMVDQGISEVNHMFNHGQTMSNRVVELEKDLAVLQTEVRLLNELLSSKESEIATLKSALVIAERHVQQSHIELQLKPTGLLGKIKSLFN